MPEESCKEGALSEKTRYVFLCMQLNYFAHLQTLNFTAYLCKTRLHRSEGLSKRFRNFKFLMLESNTKESIHNSHDMNGSTFIPMLKVSASI